MPYSAALDGLRAVAILLVIFFHSQVPFIPGGNVGVDVFFVLSGYLITRVLLVEHALSGALNLRRFYRQRLLRLTPPLLFMLLLYAVFAPLIWADYYFHARDWFVVLTYQADLALVFGMAPEKMIHAWSLGVEERFYLLWPLALLGLLALSVRKAVLAVLVIVVLIGFWRMTALQFLSMDSNEAYYRFDMRVSGLLLGAALGIWIGRNLSVSRRLLRCRWLLLSWGGMLVVILCPVSDRERLSFGLPLVEATVLLTIVWLNCCPQGILGRMLSWRPLAYVGQLSYGLYLFHYPIMSYLQQEQSWGLTLLLGGGLSLIMAVLNHHLIEQPIRRWRKSMVEARVSAAV